MGSAEPTTLNTDLHAVFEELRQLREESKLRQKVEAEFLSQLRQKDEAVQRLWEQITQLSPSKNICLRARNFTSNDRDALYPRCLLAEFSVGGSRRVTSALRTREFSVE